MFFSLFPLTACRLLGRIGLESRPVLQTVQPVPLVFLAFRCLYSHPALLPKFPLTFVAALIIQEPSPPMRLKIPEESSVAASVLEKSHHGALKIVVLRQSYYQVIVPSQCAQSFPLLSFRSALIDSPMICNDSSIGKLFDKSDEGLESLLSVERSLAQEGVSLFLDIRHQEERFLTSFKSGQFNQLHMNNTLHSRRVSRAVSLGVKAQAEQLQQRNQKLKKQIAQINSLLNQQQSIQPKKSEQVQPSQEVLSKQVQNSLKQLKMYERQLQRLRNKESAGILRDRLKNLSEIQQQKKKLILKLKQDLNQVNRSIAQNSKLLRNDSAKIDLQTELAKLNEQINWFTQRIRQYEQKAASKTAAQKKQQNYIRALQDKCSGMGFIPFQEQVKQAVQSKTHQKLTTMKNQLKVMAKLNADYQKQLKKIQSAKVSTSEQSQSLNKQSQALQAQLKSLTEQLKALRARVDKKNLKPILRSKLDQSSLSKDKPKLAMPESIKIDFKGRSTPKSIKFNDRTIVKTYESKIVMMKVWVDSDFIIRGMQAFYSIASKLIPGTLIIRSEEGLTEMKMECRSTDYLHQVLIMMSITSVLEFLQLTTKQGQVHRFGIQRPGQKQSKFELQAEQVPSCLFGAWQPGQGKYASITQIGMQIVRMKQYKTESG